MKDMVERVAEAIMARVDDFKTVAVNGYDDPGLRDLLVAATCEVIEAMREPTSVMLSVVDPYEGENAEIYTRMLDAALDYGRALKRA